MTLGEKIRHLRSVEGTLRGLGRPLTQAEMIQQMKREQKRAISQSYLSQIESGARPHMTHGTRQLLARFFKVDPGFLVNDAEGFRTSLGANWLVRDEKVDSWLYAAAEAFRGDPKFADALRTIAEYPDTRKAMLLLAEVLRVPDLAEHLHETLSSGPTAAPREASREMPGDVARS
jgi:transcriptional regulator with XRE-family HTH domain